MRPWWRLKIVVRADSWQYNSGPLANGLPSGSRNISMPASSRAATRAFAPVAASRATIPTGAPPLTYSVLLVQQEVCLDPETQLRLGAIERVGLPPADFSGGDVHGRDHGAVGGGAAGRRVGDPVVAEHHAAAQRPRRHRAGP